MSDVILLNAFDVRLEQVDDCIAYWEEAADIMRAADGFHSTELHQAIDGQARFQLVNRAHWHSAEAFKKVITSPAFIDFTARNTGRFDYFPGLYRIVRS